eukprot:776283-Rhodomonas_salina.3
MAKGCGHGAVTVPQQDQTQTDEDTRQGWERFASPEGLGLIVVLRSCAFHFGKNRLVVGHLRDSMNPEHNVSLRSLRDDSVAGTDHGRSSAQRSVAVPPPLWTDLLILCTSKSNSRKHTPVLRLWLSFAGSTVELEEAGTSLASGSIDQIRTGTPLYKYTTHGYAARRESTL